MQQIETGSVAKKRKTDEVKTANTEADSAQHFNAFEASIKEFINEKFDATSKFNEIPRPKDEVNNCHIVDRISREAVNRCRSLAELKEVVEPDFQFDYESTQVYCQLCV